MTDRRRMAPQDATMYWLSKRTPNDQFLLYSFADAGVQTAELRAHIERRSAHIPDLRVRLREVPRDLDYPSWVRCEFSADQFVEHDLPQADWSHVQAALGELLGTGVDAADRPWRLHVFRGVAGAPMRSDAAELATVVVLQMSHALADGKRAAAVARSLFGKDDPLGRPPSPCHPERGSRLHGRFFAALRMTVGTLRVPIQVAQTMARGYQAYRAQRTLVELTESGRLPGPGPSFTPSAVNQAVAEANTAQQARMLVWDAGELRIPGRTMTVVALTAVSLALPNYLTTLGKPVDRSGAQVPMALPGKALPRNNYCSLGVDLHIDEPDLRRRADRIAAALSDRRTRAEHPLLSAQDRVTSVTPAAVLRRDLDRYPLDTVPDAISGHTVVSSVHRGSADLSFGGPVRFTAGFPAIGSVMHLTHGVHGLGDTVTISVHADAATITDIDAYAELLRSAVQQVVAAHAVPPTPG
ncbi:wax ester/triacylglycerol synthase domain-containing protein [Nocardia sp. XZ_19_385]|uniref:wax ester/triacylglycerol synthase domain-containing protein n=1 Tax=Nocardia sp. XZ_19_385 TaxID=2769488 RepID=UPI00188E4E72|nr:wax ester/triacylglycerol synthase domain-containing protein [Nocardia sp. XZ_19_385]